MKTKKSNLATNKKVQCDHKGIEKRIYEEDVWNYYGDCHETEEVERWEECSLFEDLDTHRMKCSRCGEIKYYSKAAKDYYEKGIPSDYINPRFK